MDYCPRQLFIPGIVGGMGPLAGITFEHKLLRESFIRGAKSDQEHPVWLMINATTIPDRTESLLGEQQGCVMEIKRYSSMLEKIGADFIVVPCNTAHVFHAAVQEQLSIPWINIIELVKQHVCSQFPGGPTIGLIATNGTILSKVYEKTLKSTNIRLISPPLGTEIQNAVMRSIYNRDFGLKSTGPDLSPDSFDLISQACEWLFRQGAEAIICGCTEISAAIQEGVSFDFNLIDPLEVLARTTIDLCYGRQDLNTFKPLKSPQNKFGP